MLSAGLLGGPGIGYKQDYFASNELQSQSSATYDRYKSDEANSFLFFPTIHGLDGRKVGVLFSEAVKNESGEEIGRKVLIDEKAAIEKSGRKPEEDKNYRELAEWWEKDGKQNAQGDKGGSKSRVCTAVRWP